MISLRTHAISLAAVFLALAIGVALGSGLLSNTVLSGLRDDKQELQHQIDGLVDQKNALNKSGCRGTLRCGRARRLAGPGPRPNSRRSYDDNDDSSEAAPAARAPATLSGCCWRSR